MMVLLFAGLLLIGLAGLAVLADRVFAVWFPVAEVRAVRDFATFIDELAGNGSR